MDLTNIETPSEKLFGIFELDEAGTVRYSKTRDADGVENSMIGKDFFDLSGFENREDLRRHFKRFIISNQAADVFTFDCKLRRSVVRTKVLMTRAFLTEYFPAEGLVMLDIRMCGDYEN